jgi:DNA-directed RNA polymerase subunit RPC12/RpoP
MKRVCAWCGRELDQSECREDMQVTHGVCPICRRRFFASAKANEADSQPTQEDVSNDLGKTGGHTPTE